MTLSGAPSLNLQTIINVILILVTAILTTLVIHLYDRLKQTEQVVQGGGIYAEFVKTKQITVVNPNGLEVIKLESDPLDLSGYGDGLVLVNEGQGLDNQTEKLQASVQIRASSKLGGMVAAQSHRIFEKTKDGRLKLEAIHPLAVKTNPSIEP